MRAPVGDRHAAASAREGSRREAGLFIARISTMNKGLLLIAAALLVVSAAYSLDRGILLDQNAFSMVPRRVHT